MNSYNNTKKKQENEICYINDFLESWINKKIFGEFPIKQDFPNITNIISQYKETINSLLNEYSPPVLEESEIFMTTILLPFNNFYTIAWIVTTAKNLIDQFNIPISNLPLDQLIYAINNDKINPNHLIYACNNNAPVILAEYLGRILVIDGRHRILAKFLVENKTINAYVLPDKIHLQAMPHEIYRVLYKIHYNIDLICNYMCGVKTLEQTNALLLQI